jgi:hypothetical protein
MQVMKIDVIFENPVSSSIWWFKVDVSVAFWDWVITQLPSTKTKWFS